MMVVGETGSGKTTNMRVLGAALGQLYEEGIVDKDGLYKKVELKILNPKAITAPQMFGKMDAATGDWTDGVFAVLWRKGTKAKNQNTWICLDGPVDAIVTPRVPMSQRFPPALKYM